MIKEIKNQKNGKTSYNLEQEIKEQEKELNAIKQVFELNDLNALNVLPIKNIQKTKKNSVRIPKKLTEREKEKRKELKKLQEIEELQKIQMTLFKDINKHRKRNNQLNPISQRIPSTGKEFYKTEDVFASNLNKECEKILGNKKNKKYNPSKTVIESDWINKKNININTKLTQYKRINNKIDYNKEYNKEINDINEIINNSNKNDNIDNDEDKDKKFLDNLDNNLKIFYMTKTLKIFEFLKEINLVRYIQCFLNEGFDLFEEFIELPLDFFDKMKNPFLNQKQREKLYKKLEPYKNINKKQKINNENKKGILNNENKKEILNDENKKELNIKIKSEIGCGTNTEIIEKNIEKIKVDNSSNYPVDNSVLTPDDFICCWNCYKPLKKENSILKKDNNLYKDDELAIFQYKNFCSEKCYKIFENEKIVKKLFKTENINQFTDTKNKEEKETNKDNENLINDKGSNINDEEDYSEEDNYDPMDDF